MGIRVTAVVLAAVSLGGCEARLGATYADEAGVTRYEFARNGTVTISVLGSRVRAEYRVDGDRVVVSSPQGTVVLSRRDDYLVGPMGLELARVDNKPSQ